MKPENFRFTTILEQFRKHPYKFELMTKEKLEELQDSPEILYADGEMGLVEINGITYRYWIDTVFEE